MTWNKSSPVFLNIKKKNMEIMLYSYCTFKFERVSLHLGFKIYFWRRLWVKLYTITKFSTMEFSLLMLLLAVLLTYFGERLNYSWGKWKKEEDCLAGIENTWRLVHLEFWFKSQMIYLGSGIFHCNRELYLARNDIVMLWHSWL